MFYFSTTEVRLFITIYSHKYLSISYEWSGQMECSFKGLIRTICIGKFPHRNFGATWNMNWMEPITIRACATNVLCSTFSQNGTRSHNCLHTRVWYEYFRFKWSWTLTSLCFFFVIRFFCSFYISCFISDNQVIYKPYCEIISVAK